jgi:hypothetical protein
VDIFGHLRTSAPCAWSVFLSVGDGRGVSTGKTWGRSGRDRGITRSPRRPERRVRRDRPADIARTVRGTVGGFLVGAPGNELVRARGTGIEQDARSTRSCPRA